MNTSVPGGAGEEGFVDGAFIERTRFGGCSGDGSIYFANYIITFDYIVYHQVLTICSFNNIYTPGTLLFLT